MLFFFVHFFLYDCTLPFNKIKLTLHHTWMPIVPPPNIKQPLAQSQGEAGWQRHDIASFTCMSNFFCHWPSSGYVSWRSQIHGSWYVSKLCEVFRKYCEKFDVMTMMVKVNDEVSDAFTRQGYKQCPAPVVTLRKRIYFNNNWMVQSWLRKDFNQLHSAQ